MSELAYKPGGKVLVTVPGMFTLTLTDEECYDLVSDLQRGLHSSNSLKANTLEIFKMLSSRKLSKTYVESNA